jgi:hypothetical protein
VLLARFRPSLRHAVVVMGGLITSTLLTLIVLPTIYLLFATRFAAVDAEAEAVHSRARGIDGRAFANLGLPRVARVAGRVLDSTWARQ